MIACSTPYPKMKDSGVEWLGQVPSHWTRLPGRACYREKKVPNKGLAETTVLSLSYGHIVVKPPEKLHGLVPASFETYQIVEPGDIIVRPTDLQNDWNSLRFGLRRDRGVITSAYMCLCTEEAVTRPYGHLLLHTYDLKKVLYGLGSGLRQNLDWSDFKYLPCEDAPPVIRKVHKRGTEANPLRGLFAATVNGRPAVVEYEPDSDLRDTEQVPLQEEGGIEAFLRREVLPYASDAWYRVDTVKTGYEISFTRYFYKPKPMRTLEEIRADILALDKETEGLLGDILGISGNRQ